MARTRWLCGLMMMAASAICLAEDQPPVQILKTGSGVRYGIWPAKPAQPVPTVFIFAGSVEDTLNNAYFRQAGNQLAQQGYLCVSVDLPCHGLEVLAPERPGIEGWSDRVEKGEDFVAEATGRFRQVLDHLVETKLTNPEKVAALGTSRGGYMAVQFAAAEPRIKAVAAFAPVTDLAVLREFQQQAKHELVQKLSLRQQADALSGRSIWLIIGDRDDRVGTDEAIQFCRAITKASLQQQKSPLVDLHVVTEPQGHTTPKGAAEQAAVWIDAQLQPANAGAKP